MAKSTAPSPSSSSTATPSAPKTKYETLILGLGKERKPLYAKVQTLAANLGCKPSDLMWAGAQAMVDNPPKTPPAGATQSTGTAPGFWVLHQSDKSGKLANVRVVEVAARSQINGGDRTFIRFKKGDEKARTRALNQALKAGAYDLSLVGVKRDLKAEKFSATEHTNIA